MKSKVNQKIILSALSLASAMAAAGVSRADTPLGSWTINGTNALGDGTSGLAPVSTAANVTVGNLVLGLGPVASSTANTFGASGWGEQTTEAGAILSNAYVSTSFTAGTGFSESLSSISAYNIRRSATGPSTGIWQYEIGAGAFVNIGSAITWGSTTTATGNAQPSLTLSTITGLQNIAPGTTVTVRLLTWGDTGTAGTWYLNGNTAGPNLVINGSTVAYAGGTTSLLWTGGSGAWDQATSDWQNVAPSDTVWSNSTNGSVTTATFVHGDAIAIEAGGITANSLNFQTGSNGISLGGAGVLTLTGPGIFVAPSTTATINAQLTVNTGMNVQGGGTLVLSNTSNSFNGAVTLLGGTLSLSADGQLGNSSNGIILSGGTLQTTAGFTTARGISGGGTINVAPGSILISTGSFSTSTLTLSNTGTLALQGSAPSAGNVVFNAAGTLDMQGGSPNVASVTFNAAGTLTSSTGQLINATALNATNLTGTAIISGAGGFALAGTATVTVQVGPSTGSPAGDLNIQSALTLGGTGNNSLKKTGTGILELNGVNDNLWRVQIGSESATSTVIGGTVIINNNQSLGNNQIFLNNGTLQASTDLTNQTANGGSNNSIGIGVSIGGLDNGPAVFAGSNMEFQGASDIFQASAAQSHLTVNNTTILDGAFSSGTGTGTGLTIDGAGKLTVNGDASGMTLATKVMGTATLEINNNWGAAITVNTGARLQGHGSIAGAVSVTSGGTIAPGSSTTTLTINNSLSLASGSNSAFVIDAPSTPGLGNSSNIAGITTLSYGGNLAITLGTGTLVTGDGWKLFTFTAGQTGSFDNNSVFGTNGSGSLLPDLSILDSSDPSAKWFFNYATGTLSIADSGGGGAPATLLWTGGNATWDQATPLWENTSPNDTVWNNTTNGPATVATFNTASTIAIDAAGVASNGLNFQAGSNGILLNGAGAITLNGPIVSVDPSVTATIAAKISGTSGFDLVGGGTLVLSSTASDFTGTVSVNAGILSISDDRNLGNSSNAITFSGGTLQATASINTARSISGAGTLDIAPATTFASTGSFNTTSLALVNAGTLDLQGSSPNVGALTLTVASTLTSSTGQQITAAGISATNLNGTATISSTGGLNLGTATSTINVGATGTLIIQAPITGAQLTNASKGVLDLFGNNSNMTRVSMSSGSGIININNPNALGNSQLFFNGGTLNATTDLTSSTGNALPIGISIGTDSTTGSAAAVLTGSNMEFTGATGLFEEPNEFTHVSVQNTTTLSGAFTSDSPAFAGLGLIVDGGGALVINGDASGMLRNTIVNGATSLIVNNNFGGAVTLNSGTLAGHGTIAGNVIAGSGAHTIYPSATLASGSATTLTVGGLTTNANTTLQFNLVTPNSPGGSDLINVTGSNGLNVSGGTLSLVDNFAGEGYYKILQYSGAIGGTGLSSLTIPSVVTNTGPAGKEAYILDTHHDAGFVDVHKVLIGDANGDGTVDGADFDVWFTHLLDNTFDYGSGDFNGDGHVDGADFDIWFTHLLNTFGGTDTSFGGFTDTQLSELSEFLTPAQMADLPSGVPEPASLALLGMGAVGLLARRRRRKNISESDFALP